MGNLRHDPRQDARARTAYLATRFGSELRIARTTAGLSQARLARVAGVGQTVVSRAERGDPRVSLSVRCALVAACGHEIGWRLYPVASVRLRDSGQLALAQVIGQAAYPGTQVQLEVPVAPADPRAADMLLIGREEVVHVEIERTLVDAQAQIRAAMAKRTLLAQQEPRPVRLVIVVPDSATVRQRLEPARELLHRAFPVSPRRAWEAIRKGEPIGGDALVMIRAHRTPSRRPQPGSPAAPGPLVGGTDPGTGPAPSRGGSRA